MTANASNPRKQFDCGGGGGGGPPLPADCEDMKATFPVTTGSSQWLLGFDDADDCHRITLCEALGDLGNGDVEEVIGRNAAGDECYRQSVCAMMLANFPIQDPAPVIDHVYVSNSSDGCLRATPCDVVKSAYGGAAVPVAENYFVHGEDADGNCVKFAVAKTCDNTVIGA